MLSTPQEESLWETHNPSKGVSNPSSIMGCVQDLWTWEQTLHHKHGENQMHKRIVQPLLKEEDTSMPTVGTLHEWDGSRWATSKEKKESHSGGEERAAEDNSVGASIAPAHCSFEDQPLSTCSTKYILWFGFDKTRNRGKMPVRAKLSRATVGDGNPTAQRSLMLGRPNTVKIVKSLLSQEKAVEFVSRIEKDHGGSFHPWRVRRKFVKRKGCKGGLE